MNAKRKRRQLNVTLSEEVLDRLKNTSDDTMIPQARLVEKGIEEVLKQYEQKGE